MKKLVYVLIPITVSFTWSHSILADEATNEAYPEVREIAEEYNARCVNTAFFALVSELFVFDPTEKPHDCYSLTATTQSLNRLDLTYFKPVSDEIFRNDYASVIKVLPNDLTRNLGPISQYSDLSNMQSGKTQNLEEKPIRTVKGYVTTGSD